MKFVDENYKCCFKLLFFKTTDMYTLDKKIWKNIFRSGEIKYEKDFSEYICRQLKNQKFYFFTTKKHYYLLSNL